MREEQRPVRTLVGAVTSGLVSLILSACGAAGAATDARTVAMIPGYAGGTEQTSAASLMGYGPGKPPPVTASLSDADPTHMSITLSQNTAPTGKVSFLVSNDGTETHEFVVLATDTPAAEFPIVSFEGEANRIDEDAKGVTNVGETGDMKVGTSQMLTLDLAPGHYAVVCNLPGHYAAGMHQDFWVTPAGRV
jgi:uncharacterized cupredoxin-like copper-binding protein